MSLSTTSHAAPASAAPALYDKRLLRGALGLAVLSVAGFGFLYSLAGVGMGQALFRSAANGSLIVRNGTVIGSVLVAQPFGNDRYFQPRPSAADHQPMAAAGSNQARTNPEMRKRVEEARAAVAGREKVDPSEVPSDLVTQSGSGFDPHISPQAAAIQVQRVARTRGIAAEVVAGLVAQHTEPPKWGVLGQSRVNVLQVNLALDRLAATAPSTLSAPVK
jgi:K+-transporting ATPase ATPase C chain